MQTNLKSCTLVQYPVHVVLLNFKKKYKNSLLQSGHNLVALFPVETEKSEGLKDAHICDPREVVNRYFTFKLLEDEESIQVTSVMERGKEDRCFA